MTAVFKTVVADPPWRVAAGRTIGAYARGIDGRQLFGVRSNAARRLAYPSMTVEEIAACRPPTASSAHLYLWTINAYVREAYDVARAWGFTPSTLLVWAKRPMGGGLGGSYGLATEYCLFARRGSLASKCRIGRNWFDWRRPYENGHPKHSAKPPEFFAMVAEVSPGPYLEMFARAPRDGWAVWGNEVVSTTQMMEGTDGRSAAGQ